MSKLQMQSNMILVYVESSTILLFISTPWRRPPDFMVRYGFNCGSTLGMADNATGA